MSLSSNVYPWIYNSISSATGLAEPEYGPSAFHSVADSVVDIQPFTETTPADFNWLHPETTNVETQTFYFSNEIHWGFAQIIHSNIVGVYTTAQLSVKIFKHNDSKSEKIWTTDPLVNFQPNGQDFISDDLNFKFEYNEETKEEKFILKANVNKESRLDLIFKRKSPGFKIGGNGVSVFGYKLEEPWGIMRHAFWPRADVNGTITTIKKSASTVNDDNDDKSTTDESEAEDEVIKFENGKGMFVMALQGMKPHHAASRWEFLNFQSKNYSVVLMQFTTPASYGSKIVSVGCVAKDDEILAATVNNKIAHVKTENDEETGWNPPTEIKFILNGPGSKATDEEIKSGKFKSLTATIEGKLNFIYDKIIIMAEIPNIVKNLVSGIVGIKPVIYQFDNTLKLKLELPNGEMIEEEGDAISETTFIS